MNALLEKSPVHINILLTTVTLTPIVQTPRDHSIALVIRDTQEMVLFVWVSRVFVDISNSNKSEEN